MLYADFVLYYSKVRLKKSFRTSVKAWVDSIYKHIHTHTVSHNQSPLKKFYHQCHHFHKSIIVWVHTPILDHRTVCTIKTIKTPPIRTVLCPLVPEILPTKWSGHRNHRNSTESWHFKPAAQKCLKYQVPVSCTHPHHFLLLFTLENWAAGLGTHQYTLEDHGKQDAGVRRRLLGCSYGGSFYLSRVSSLGMRIMADETCKRNWKNKLHFCYAHSVHVMVKDNDHFHMEIIFIAFIKKKVWE